MTDIPATNPSAQANRRDFLKTSAVGATTVALASQIATRAYAAADDTLRIGLVGCGGRGTGAAAQALSADKNTKLVAMADAFGDNIENSLKNLQSNDSFAGRITVDDAHKFTGFDGCKNMLAAGVDVILLCSPPHFRPEHMKLAVDAGVHMFVEKPIAVDAPGVRSVLETSKKAAERNLAVVSGLCWRYDYGMRATFEQIHQGTIGDIVAMQCSYDTRGLWRKPRKPEWSDMEWQVRNWLYFTWLSGDHGNEQAIHSLDKMAWAMKDVPPVVCSATGGRQVRVSPDFGNIYDHFAATYEYANGVKMFFRSRQQDGTQVDVSDHVLGTKGRADIFKHRIVDNEGKVIWKYEGPRNNMYQTEHDEFFASIRKGQPINNGEYMCYSTMLAIMCRMSAYTGQKITWEQAMNSQEVLGPKAYEWGPLPVEPVAMPGLTQFI